MEGYILAKIKDHLEYHHYLSNEELNLIILDAEVEMPVLAAKFDHEPVFMAEKDGCED